MVPHVCPFIRLLLFRHDNSPFNLSQARVFLSDIEVILGQLVITNWGEAVFDYLPNLMYIGGFEGSTLLGTLDSSLILTKNSIPFVNVNLTQIHFPRLVEVSEGNITLTNNIGLCYIGSLEFYLKSMNQAVIYEDPFDPSAIPQKPYSECGTYAYIM